MFFGLVIGMVALGTWEAFKSAQTAVSSEASAVASLYRSVDLMPDENAQPLRDAVRGYTSFVVDSEWPEQRRGVSPEGGEVHVAEIGRLLYALSADTPEKEAKFNVALANYYHFIEMRRERVHSVQVTRLPAGLWWVVVSSTVILISLSMLMHIANLRLDIAINVLMSFLTGSVLAFIIAMDNPYRGELSVSPDAFEALLQHQMAPD